MLLVVIVSLFLSEILLFCSIKNVYFFFLIQ